MQQHVRPGGLCYEPFSGSGSQIMAGEVNGRRVFAIEISPGIVKLLGRAQRGWETGRRLDHAARASPVTSCHVAKA